MTTSLDITKHPEPTPSKHIREKIKTRRIIMLSGSQNYAVSNVLLTMVFFIALKLDLNKEP